MHDGPTCSCVIAIVSRARCCFHDHCGLSFWGILDDDCASRLLARLLSAAGHDVQRPAMVDLDGASDASHLTHAIRESRVLVTANHNDFEALPVLNDQFVVLNQWR